MRCPRCQRASPDEAVFCPGCGAPLALRAEPAPRRLDLSISLDRRAGAHERALDPAREAAHGAAWDLRGRLGLATPPPSAALESDDDELRFGPLPELGPDPEPLPGPALEPRAAEPAFAPEPGSEEPAPAAPGPLARALGLAPDPVVPEDLELAAIAGAPAEPLVDTAPGGVPHEGTAREASARDPDLDRDRGLDRRRDPALDRDLDHGLHGDLALDPAVDLDRDLALDRDLDRDQDLDLRRGPAGAGLGRELDLALEVPGRPEEERALDVSLTPSAQPDQLPLPLAGVGTRPRGARPGRRAAAWAVDVAPLALLWTGGLAAVYARVPLTPGDHAGLLERVLRDGGALALPLLAVVATLGLVHQTLAHALAGATLGKWLLGLRVVSEEGERPAVGRCAARAALSAASVLLLGLGLVPALFTRSGRALHDISAGTRVIEAP